MSGYCSECGNTLCICSIKSYCKGCEELMNACSCNTLKKDEKVNASEESIKTEWFETYVGDPGVRMIDYSAYAELQAELAKIRAGK